MSITMKQSIENIKYQKNQPVNFIFALQLTFLVSNSNCFNVSLRSSGISFDSPKILGKYLQMI